MLEIKKLYKAFGEKAVLTDFSASFGQGIHGISAPSGKGKTTLLRIIAKLEGADSGTVSGGGKISFAFQEPRLIPWIDAQKNAAISERAQGLGKEILSELGLDSEIGSLPSKLSGGMQKRVSVARALAAEFDTLLLDEPFAGLDEKTAIKTLEVIRRHTVGKCVLLVTHDTEMLDLLDSVIKL